MKRIIAIFLMFSILNHSVDFDYLLIGATGITNMAGYDDIDSITEYFIEKIAGNDKFTSEEDDDSGNPVNKSFEKNLSDIAFYCSPARISPQFPIISTIITWPQGLDLANKTCKGYFNITSPPPDIIAA